MAYLFLVRPRCHEPFRRHCSFCYAAPEIQPRRRILLFAVLSNSSAVLDVGGHTCIRLHGSPLLCVLKPRSRMSCSSTCDSPLSCCATLLDLSHSYWVFLLPANFNGITGRRRS